MLAAGKGRSGRYGNRNRIGEGAKMILMYCKEGVAVRLGQRLNRLTIIGSECKDDI